MGSLDSDFKRQRLVDTTDHEILRDGHDEMGRGVVVAVEVNVLVIDIDMNGIVQIAALDEYHLPDHGVGESGIRKSRVSGADTLDDRLPAAVIIVGT